MLAGFTMPMMVLAVEDSIGVETVDGKTYVLHRIEQGETLYRISVTYKVAVEEIYAANPGLVGSVYRAGEVIRVPMRGAPPVEAKTDNGTGRNKPTPGTTTDGTTTHKVAPGETLFSIARQYGLTVKDLMSINGMTTADIREGQTLKVTKPVQSETDAAVTTQTQPPADTGALDLTVSGDPAWTGESRTPAPSMPYSAQYAAMLSSGAWVQLQANGAVTWVPELRQHSQGFFALHKTIPVGSLIQVKNPVNGKTITAKVVGKLPANTPDNVVLKLPSTAKQPLKIFDEVMFVEVSYLVPKE